jgi:hypothetical protein
MPKEQMISHHSKLVQEQQPIPENFGNARKMSSKSIAPVVARSRPWALSLHTKQRIAKLMKT